MHATDVAQRTDDGVRATAQPRQRAPSPAPPPALDGLSPADRVLRCHTVDDVMEWAAELGFHGPLGAAHPDADTWLGEPTDAERSMLDLLLQQAERRVLTANDEKSWVGRMCTALHWLALFVALFPHLRLFRPLGGPTHRQNAAHNENTWAALQEFMRRHGSIKRGRMGEPITQDGISAVISTLRAFRSIGARYSLLTPDCNEWLPRIRKQMRKEDGPKLERKLQLGIRAQHFDQLDKVGWDRRSLEGIYDHSLAHTLKIVIGRGGEAGLREKQKQSDFDPARAPTIEDFKTHFPAQAGVNDGLPWLRALWYPIKDQHGTHRKMPTPISKRSHSAPGADPADPYDAIMAWWAIRSQHKSRRVSGTRLPSSCIHVPARSPIPPTCATWHGVWGGCSASRRRH